MADNGTKPELILNRRDPGVLLLELKGDWLMGAGLPSVDAVREEIKQGSVPSRLEFVTHQLDRWDSGLMTFVTRCADLARTLQARLVPDGLPEGARGLLSLAEAVPEKEDTGHGRQRGWNIFYHVGSLSSSGVISFFEIVAFIGEMTLAFLKMLVGKARFRTSDTWLVIQQTGVEALPIVALISFLVGLIMGFVGAVQLQQFGASIYVANLVGLAMVREMGVLMTGIIMCGRTGAAFAAQLGSMKVNEEIDALQTLGISPIEFLVLPRMLALSLMMPLLVLFSNFIGILGGMVVTVGILDVTVSQYINQTVMAIDLTNFSTGIIKSIFFGVLVAATGCLRGMQCGSSSSAVGLAATSAVVSGITSLIVADAIFAVIFNIIGL